MTHLTITRKRGGPVRMFPGAFRLTPRSFGVSGNIHPLSGRISVPRGWEIEPAGPLAWFVRPRRVRLDRPATVQLELISPLGRRYQWSLQIDIKLDLETTFDPLIHPVPFRNSSREIGVVPPALTRMRRTFLPLPGWLERALFGGLYRQIVRLGGEGDFGGGLCSGMARWAGLRSIGAAQTATTTDEALDEITVLHGRQLTDRALLTGLPWFLRGSPRAAFRAVRADALHKGQSLRAFDIGVPRLWRRDVVRALFSEGHSIVPFRIRQESAVEAYVDCYDPNCGPEPQTMEFRLDRDRYAYRDRVSLSDRGVGLIAVPHAAYARRGTAILALAGSAIWLAARRFISSVRD